jgi:hypothetical protein
MKNLEEMILSFNNEHKVNSKESIKSNRSRLLENLKLEKENESKTLTSGEQAASVKETSVAQLNKINNIVCWANSLSSFIIISDCNRKNSENVKDLTIKIYDAVNLWLSRLFRLILFYFFIFLNFKFTKFNFFFKWFSKFY